jgi:hypothetical protein
MTGLDGTPMPSFADNIKPDEAWDLVFYLRTFMHQHSKEKEMAKQLQLKPVDPNAPHRRANSKARNGIAGTVFSF